ncbi:MAG: RraA family protein [Acidimicrobiia bacterium]
MAKPILDDGQLDALRKYDTPTICNALDILLPNERKNFNTSSLFCAFPKLPPMVGYAKTAMVRSTQPTLNTPEQHMNDRFNYWTYLSKGPLPAISVIQDLDGSEAGYGAFWGEVNSNAHKALGCIGTITDNSIRDLDVIPEGFQMLTARVVPYGGTVYLVDWDCRVNVFGLVVKSGDLIHADVHGAVTIPDDVAGEVTEAAELVIRREAVMLAEAKRPGVTPTSLREAYIAAAKVD